MCPRNASGLGAIVVVLAWEIDDLCIRIEGVPNFYQVNYRL